MKRGFLAPSVSCCLLFALSLAPPAQELSIVNSKHNLSVSGPGTYKAVDETRVCIFCHTPHRSRAVAPLWNRADSQETYLLYGSTTFQGQVDQPSGSSKLCLSCHDGSIALGSVFSMSADIQMAAGFDHLQSGPAFIGTSLADDHPISFDYSLSKGGSGKDFVDEAAIPPPVHLDPAGMVQCTSCHDAHNNFYGSFLHTTDRYSVLCLSCHAPTGWLIASHSLSGATWDGAGTDPWPKAKYTTVAENACANCHRPHGAAHPARLLVFSAEEDTCLGCHSGHVAAEDIESALLKPFRHDPFGTLGTHDPLEDPLTMARHSECQDCHNPHAVRAGTALPPAVPGPLTGIGGLSGFGQVVAPINFGYELCYKCHADNNGGTAYVPRQILQTNVRFEFDPGNPSFHPIEAPGMNPDVPSLKPGWTEASIVACTDCHQSDDSPTFGGTGAAGPHGSMFKPLLGANYNLQDGLPESPQAYALCYRCHSRESILDDRSFKRHEDHIVDENVACKVCHDPHGISASQGNPVNNSHLINFDLSVVSPSPTTGQLYFMDEGFQAGSCSLLCHGEDHDPADY